MAVDLSLVREYVSLNIHKFHENKLTALKSLNLNKILKKKNPYLFRAKNITLASELVSEIMNAHISSSEEKIFGDFLEDLAIFISGMTYQGRKSSTTGIDIEMFKDDVQYLISVKSGESWGNSSSVNKLEQDFKTALRVLKQSSHGRNAEAVLGICYGKNKSSIFKDIFQKYIGQRFWHFISGNEDLYIEIVEPLGYMAKEHNDAFIEKRDALINTFTLEFSQHYCNTDGTINWTKIVEFNSGNM